MQEKVRYDDIIILNRALPQPIEHIGRDGFDRAADRFESVSGLGTNNLVPVHQDKVYAVPIGTHFLRHPEQE